MSSIGQENRMVVDSQWSEFTEPVEPANDFEHACYDLVRAAYPHEPRLPIEQIDALAALFFASRDAEYAYDAMFETEISIDTIKAQVIDSFKSKDSFALGRLFKDAARAYARAHIDEQISKWHEIEGEE